MTDPHTLDIPPAPPFPNSRLPVLLYRAALPADPGIVEQTFAACGWSNAWRNGIYRFPGGGGSHPPGGDPPQNPAAAGRAAAVSVPDRGPLPGHDALRRLWGAAVP